MICSMVFLFVKQRTAYEMRISDWSSDVCSSDLAPGHANAASNSAAHAPPPRSAGGSRRARTGIERLMCPILGASRVTLRPGVVARALAPATLRCEDSRAPGEGARSEEHTSELQSLMRISYAVFCLKTKQNSNNITIHTLIETY